MKITIYDAEIKRGIVKKGEEQIPGIEYCEGWRDYKNMGVSTVCAYDYHEGRYRVFCADNFDEFLMLLECSDLMVGFNNLGFDDPLLSVAIQDFIDITTPRYDLLSEIWVAAGLKPKWGGGAYGGYGLDAMCEANFGVRKTGHGADAPVDWQRGKIGKVIDYCVNDIFMTKLLMDCAIAGDDIINPKGGMLSLRTPYSPPNVHSLEEVLAEETVELVDEVREGLKEVADGEPHHWDNLAVEYMEVIGIDKWVIAVLDNDGLVIKRRVSLSEWSGEVCPRLTAHDGPGLIKYLEDHRDMYARIGDNSGTVE